MLAGNILGLLKGERQKIKASPQPNVASLEVFLRDIGQHMKGKMHFGRLGKEVGSLTKPQHLKPLSSAPLWVPPSKRMQYTYASAYIHTCMPCSPFTLLFLSGPVLCCESRSCCVGRGLPEIGGRLSFLTSLRKSCNCSFPFLPLISGVYACNPTHYMYLTPSLDTSPLLRSGTRTNACAW